MIISQAKSLRGSRDPLRASAIPPPAYLQEPVAGLADEGESHGSLGHGQLAASVPRRRPSELPQLLGDGEEQGHGHQAGGQRGQSRDQVERVEQHGDGEPLVLWSARWRSKRRSRFAPKKSKCVNLNNEKFDLGLRKNAARLKAADDFQTTLTRRKKKSKHAKLLLRG